MNDRFGVRRESSPLTGRTLDLRRDRRSKPLDALDAGCNLRGMASAGESACARLIEIKLDGHLTEPALYRTLADALPVDLSGGAGLLFDCTAMTGYDLDARHAFVDWHVRERKRVVGVAIVTDKLLWHMVVSAMAFASGQNMKAFSSVSEAERWLRAGA